MDFSGSTQGRRYRSTLTLSNHVICLAVLLLFVISKVAAYDMMASKDAQDSAFFKRLAQDGEIHIDTRSIPMVQGLHLVRRNATSESKASTATSSSLSSSSSSSITTAKNTHSSSESATVTSIAAAIPTGVNNTSSTTTSTSTASTTTADTTLSALPTPFDTSLGNNFTAQTCPTFFNSFINNATFKSCLPVSLLLQNSMGFFRASRSLSLLDQVLDASCSASLVICSPLMSSIANDLIADTNCGPDYRRQNPIVMQAYTGLVAYEPLYNATCLKDKTTANYCFAEAVSNTTNAGNVYPYYTALGIQLPSSASPTCNTCLQQTMNIFAGYAKQKDQPLAKTYIPCATQVDGVCGPSFANANVKVAVDSSTNAALKPTSSAFTTVAVMTALSLLLLS